MLLGSRSDTHRLYPAMDVFAFPSRYEGLGIAAVESQMCGVRTVISCALPAEARISGSTAVLDLKGGTAPWVREVMSGRRAEEAREKGPFDVSLQAARLEDFYWRTAYGKEDPRQHIVPGEPG